MSREPLFDRTRYLTAECKVKRHSDCSGYVDRAYDEPHDHLCSCQCSQPVRAVQPAAGRAQRSKTQTPEAMTYLLRWGAKGHQHRYFVDSETNDAVCLCGKVRGSKKAEPGKYHAIRTIYNGYPYDSKFEAETAMSLDWRKRAGDIKH